MRPDIINAEDAAQYLGWSVHYVRRLARQRRIPSVKLGRQWRFFSDDLVEWIRQGQPIPDQQASLFESPGGQ